MSAPLSTATRQNVLDRLGLPPVFLAGVIGLIFFMIGDGVDAGFISPYMSDNGAGSVVNASYIITVYGLLVVIGSFFAGPLCNSWGPRTVMIVGAATWVIFDILFLSIAIPSHSYPLMFVFYGIRGLGYPLFIYAFYAWLLAGTTDERHGAATGWFYVGFVGGFTLGPFIASFAIQDFGLQNTLWLGLAIVAFGALIAIIGIREKVARETFRGGMGVGATIASAALLTKTHPRIIPATIARILNNGPVFGMLVFLPAVFAFQLGYGLSAFLMLITITLGTTVVFNLIGGIIGDKFGWRRVSIIGSVALAIMFPVYFFVPVALGPGYFWVAAICGILLGIALALQVPLTPLIASMAPHNPGGGTAFVGLGAGGANLVGPLIASALLPLVGPGGVIIAFAILYLVQIPLIALSKLKPSRHAETQPASEYGVVEAV